MRSGELCAVQHLWPNYGRAFVQRRGTHVSTERSEQSASHQRYKTIVVKTRRRVLVLCTLPMGHNTNLRRRHNRCWQHETRISTMAKPCLTALFIPIYVLYFSVTRVSHAEDATDVSIWSSRSNSGKKKTCARMEGPLSEGDTVNLNCFLKWHCTQRPYNAPY